jgi:transposase
MRQACNGRLRNAVYHSARVAATRDPHSSEIYAALRKRGQSHGRALRGIADRLLRVLIAMLKNRTLYDPTRWATQTPAAPPTTPATPAPA